MNNKELLFSDLSSRSTERELMDNSRSDRRLLLRTLHQFTLLNRLISGIYRILEQNLVTHMQQTGLQSYTILDLGSGGCDIPLWLLSFCRNRSINVKIVCIDSDSRVVQYGREKCKNQKNIQVVQCSAQEAVSKFKADYIISNHFLHHLPEKDIIPLLSSIHKYSSKGYLLNDIRRSRLSLWLFYALSSVLFHRSFTLTDGLISITKGFTPEQFQSFCSTAGLPSSIKEVHPGHLAIFHFRPVEP